MKRKQGIALTLLACLFGCFSAVRAQLPDSQAELQKMWQQKRAERKASPAKRAAAKPVHRAASGTGVQLYGCISYSEGSYFSDTGVYTFNTASPDKVSLVKAGVNVYGGGTYGGGTLYCNTYSESNSGAVYMPVKFYEYSTDDWSVTKQGSSTSFTSIASDMAYDPTTQRVYGCFQNASYTACKTLGRIKYGTDGSFDSESIGELPEKMVALTANAKGQLYGIGVSGMLYAIDKTTAAATEVGSTGVTPIALYQSATCDYTTGKIYWFTFYNDYWDSGIFEVDPETGAATLVSDFGYDYGTGTLEQITGLYIKQDIELPNPPAAVDEIMADFADGSLTGNVGFILPTEDIKGGTLTGELDYVIKSNGIVIAEGKGQPGAEVIKEVTVERSGEYTFSVEVTHNGVTGEAASVSKFLGNDAPLPPTDVKAVSSGSAVTLTWTAPTATVNGGRVNPSRLLYKIVRQPDGETLVTGTSGTSFTDNLPSGVYYETFTYDVTALLGKQSSTTATSNEVLVDATLKLPYDNQFTSADDCDDMFTIDANEDGNTWGYNSYNQSADYPGNSEAADDWLVTAPILMEAGTTYRFTINVSNSYPVERVEAAVGTEGAAASFVHKVIEPYEVTYSPRTHTLSGKFVPTEKGLYYFGVHAISDADRSNLHLNSIHIDAVPGTAPAAATGVLAVPGEKGAIKATVSFKAPEKTLAGDALVSGLSVRIDCDGSEVKTFTGVTPGAELSYEHTYVSEGLHTYKVTPVGADGTEGESTEAKCFIGVDSPAGVVNLKAVEDLDHEGLIHLTWDAPATGQNGGYVDPETLTYYVSTGGTESNDINVGNATSYDDQLTVNGKQVYAAYSVYAKNDKGSGRSYWKTATALAGPAVKAPMVESFAGVTYKSGPWLPEILKGEIGEAYWTTEGGTTNAGGTQDGDGGVTVFYTQTKGKASRLSSPKVDISGLDKPVLNFWVYLNGKGDEFRVSVQPDFKDYDTLYTVRTDEGATGWRRVSLPLDKYKSARFIRAGFEGESLSATSDIVAFDNVAVVNDSEADLMARTFTAPEEIKAGDSGDFTLQVRNNGSLAVKGSDYKVTLLKKGQPVQSVQGTDIAADAQALFRLSDVPGVFDDESTEYSARVDFAADGYPADNAAEAQKVKITLPSYPFPTELKANDGPMVTLEWTAPDVDGRPAEAVTEDFEDYSPFIVSDMGDWTLTDKDGQNTIKITLDYMQGELKYAHAGEPMAFQVFNPDEAGIYYNSWQPKSGSQMLVCFSTASSDGGVTKVANDDWLISPELDGSAQTVSFYAKTGMGSPYIPEQMELLYSLSGTDTESFVKVKTVDVTNSSGWKLVTFDVPQGANHFAIRCVSDDKFALLLDDITYIPYGAVQSPLTLEGYNVYRDGVKLNAEPISGTAYSDASAVRGESHSYAVTAVYDKGESVSSNIASVVYTAVNTASADPVSAVTVTVEGGFVNVRGTQPGTAITLCTADGRRIATRMAAASVERFAVQPGAYIVRAGNASFKVAR